MRLLRTVQIQKHPGVRAKVFRDDDWDEYRVELHRPDGHRTAEDYYTDDLDDALDTARLLIQANAIRFEGS